MSRLQMLAMALKIGKDCVEEEEEEEEEEELCR